MDTTTTTHTKVNQYLASIALVLGIIIMGAAVYVGVTTYATLLQLGDATSGVTESDYSTGLDGAGPSSLEEQYPDSWYLDGEGNECWDPGGGVVCAPYGG